MASSPSPPTYPYPSSLNVGNFVTIRLKPDNYLLWETQMISLIESQDLIGFITGECAMPVKNLSPASPDDSAQINPDYLAWMRTDRLVKAWITGTLSDEVLGLAVGIKTSAALWNTLSAAFSQASEAREFELLSKLHFLKKTSSIPLSTFLFDFKKICDQLASIGRPVPDQRKVFQLLTNLGPEYEHFSTAMLKPPVPTYEDLIPLLQSHDLRF